MAQQTISKMETVQTAVEWLVEELYNEMKYGRDLTKNDRKVLDEIIQQAKAMEKEQIKTSFFEGTCDWTKPYLENMQKAEKYYELTFNK